MSPQCHTSGFLLVPCLQVGQLALLAPGQASRYAVELSVGAEHALVAAFSDEFGTPSLSWSPGTGVRRTAVSRCHFLLNPNASTYRMMEWSEGGLEVSLQ